MQLKGAKGFAALQVYNSMIPFLATVSQFQTKEYTLKDNSLDMEKIVADFKVMSEQEKKVVLLESMTVNVLADQQVINLLRVHNDANGNPISPRSIDNFNVADIMKMMLETCVECSNVDTALFF